MTEFSRSRAPGDYERLAAKENLAIAYHKAGHSEAYVQTMSDLYFTRVRLYGADSPITIGSKLALAVAKANTDQNEAAKSMLDDILSDGRVQEIAPEVWSSAQQEHSDLLEKNLLLKAANQ